MTWKDAINLRKVVPFAPESEIRWEFSEKDAKAQLIYGIEKEVGESVISKKCYSKLLGRISKYPSHFQSSSVKEQLVHEISQHENQMAFIGQNRDGRSAALRAALSQHGCQLRSDSSFCQQYISGGCFCSMEEVVAVMKLTKALFNYSHKAWSNCRHRFETALEESVYSSGKSWIKAVNGIIKSQSFKNACSTSLSFDGSGYRGYGRRRGYGRYGYDSSGYDSDEYDSDGL